MQNLINNKFGDLKHQLTLEREQKMKIMKDFENFYIAQKIIEEDEKRNNESFEASISSSSFIKMRVEEARLLAIE